MKRKIRRLILCAVLLLLCAGLFWQRENIKAAIDYLRYSPDVLETKMAESSKRIDESIDSIPQVGLRPLTDEEREQLHDGSLSEEDALHIMLEEPEPAPPQTGSQKVQQTQTPEESTPPPSAEVTPEPEENEYKEEYARIAELIARVYIMRDSYSAKLESIKANAIAEYTGLSNEQRTEAKKRELAFRCIGEASALEGSCDAEIGAILSELRTLLIEVGIDTSIASDIRAAYAEEKALKKAYYMNMYIN